MNIRGKFFSGILGKKSAQENARRMDFIAGDVGYFPNSMGHYVENMGDTELCFLEMCKSSYYANVNNLILNKH